MSEGSGLLLSASFCDSQRTQTSKSVLVLTLRQALQRVRTHLTARPCRKLKARCTSEGKEERIWLRYLRQLSQSCCSYIKRLTEKRFFSTLGLTLMTLPGTMTLTHAHMKRRVIWAEPSIKTASLAWQLDSQTTHQFIFIAVFSYKCSALIFKSWSSQHSTLKVWG